MFIAASYTYREESARWGQFRAEHRGGQGESELSCEWRDCSEDEARVTLAPLLWGGQRDPIREMRLTASWPFFPEGTLVDNAVYSDLDPANAPCWQLEVEWTPQAGWHDTNLALAARKLIALVHEGGHS